jgi:hypothetical protein
MNDTTCIAHHTTFMIVEAESVPKISTFLFCTDATDCSKRLPTLNVIFREKNLTAFSTLNMTKDIYYTFN